MNLTISVILIYVKLTRWMSLWFFYNKMLNCSNLNQKYDVSDYLSKFLENLLVYFCDIQMERNIYNDCSKMKYLQIPRTCGLSICYNLIVNNINIRNMSLFSRKWDLHMHQTDGRCSTHDVWKLCINRNWWNPVSHTLHYEVMLGYSCHIIVWYTKMRHSSLT